MGRDRSETIEFRYRRRYNLTSNDDRFLDATLEEMTVDLWAHRFFDDPKKSDEFEDEDFDLAAELAAIEAEANGGSAASEDPQSSDDESDWEDLP